MARSTYTYVTYVRTTPERLWHALTTTEVVRQYWFGIDVEGDWEVGSPWAMRYDGRLMDSGQILERVAPRRLVRSWVNEWKPEFRAEGTSMCVYEVAAAGSGAKLTVTHSIDRTDSKFVAALSESWPMCLSNLKSLLETGAVVLAEHPGHDE